MYLFFADQDFSIQLFDIIGNRVVDIQKQGVSGWYKDQIDIRHLYNGIYFVELRQKDGERKRVKLINQ